MKKALQYGLAAIAVKHLLLNLFMYASIRETIEANYDTFLIVFFGILLLQEIKKLSGNKPE